MIHHESYNIETTQGSVHISITPINQPLADGNFFSTGIYKLTDGTVGMGDIIFDDDMLTWTYNGTGELTFDEAAEIADFIKNYKDPAGADPNLLQ